MTHTIETVSIFTNSKPAIELLAYDNDSKQDKQPLLFIHGVTMGAYYFEENFLPFFADKGYDVYAMNWRGHGNSEERETLKQTSLMDYYSDVEKTVAFIKERNGLTPILIGHSTGGLFTQLYISKHPATAAIMIGVGDGEKSVQNLVQWLSTSYPNQVQAFFGSGNSDHLMTNEGVQFDIMFTEENAPANAMQALKKMTTQKASDVLFADYTTYKTPAPAANTKVFLISGDQDPVGSLDAVKTAAAFYKGEYHIVHNHKHDLMLSNGWQETAEEIAKFLSVNHL
jgi:pimeloyl-ACP methyl ester carboxylesterase